MSSEGKIVLYQHNDFGGKSLELSTATPHVGAFNDIASSIVVKGGTWRVYDDVDFKGNCYTLTPGRYRNPSSWGGKNDHISSAQPAPCIVLYEHIDFGGQSRELSAASPHVGAFNDITSSIVVKCGTWLVYKDAGFEGNCYTLTPGRYPNPSSWGGKNDHISSVQPALCIVLYEHVYFGGKSQELSTATPHLGAFNDITSSIVVKCGTWLVYKDAEFEGNCYTLTPGRYPNPSSWGGKNDHISSVKPARIVLYQHYDFGGKSLELSTATPHVGAFNDMTSSIVVEGGTWRVYDDAEFEGNCYTFTPGRYPNPSSWGGKNDRISSVQPAPDRELTTGCVVEFIIITANL